MAQAIVVALLVLIAALPEISAAENTCEYAVQLSASVQTSPPGITLHWPQDQCSQPTSYVVYRKAPGANSWGPGTTLTGAKTSFCDNNVSVGSAYEYQVRKMAPGYDGYGYIYTGMDMPLVENRGRLLLVVDNTYAGELTNELARLEDDLIGDGWTVSRLTVARNDSVIKVKRLIKAQYKADPANVKCVFLFGHVPVPYSGNIVPDGHAPDHQGAWPCDGYYGDMDGFWTDHSVKVSCATEARNRNVPGDGKFDQSFFPAPLKLMVGRVDLANLPGRTNWGGPATFPSELELLRNYLHKDHKFRTRQFDLPRRALIGDYFGTRGGEAFAASAWRNFSTFFGPENITVLTSDRTWIPTLSTNTYLWAYGCGAGTFTSIEGLGNSNTYHDGVTPEIVANDVKAVFTILFGSWLGDWDAEDDLMRAMLATPSYGLTCAWSGRPHWFLQHMALGEPIGFSARLTQNNGPDGLYQNQVNNGAGQIQVALMGDPTLRMHVVAPPCDLTAGTNRAGVILTWTPSQDSILGYHVYEAPSVKGPFARVTSSLIKVTNFTAPGPAAKAYMVRAVKLETSASGTYYNASQGAIALPTAPASGSVASASIKKRLLP